jgi:Uma2 family endonuclease
MVLTDSFLAVRPRPNRSYVRPPRPVHFPESAEMPETGLHLRLRTALFLLVSDFVGQRGAVGSDQFVYWDPSDPRQCLAPDLIVRMGAVPESFPTWKIWERGAPHLGVEIVSQFDSGEAVWHKKLARYRKAGIGEVVRFDPDDTLRPVRLWDRLEGDLVERELDGENALLCDTLGLYWCVRSDAALGPVLRLSLDALGETLVPSAVERGQEREQAAIEREQAGAAALAKERARVAELEAELRRRG